MSSQLESLRELVSPRTGILKSLSLRPRSFDQPSLPIIYEGTLSNFDFRNGGATERTTCGKGLTEETAMLGAIGEGVERYCAAHPGNDLRRATTIAMERERDGAGMIPAHEFVLYSEEQRARPDFPYWRHRPDDEILWTTTLELPELRRVLVPAAFVYLNAIGDQSQDYFFGTNSSGYAAGPNLETALRSALLELIERDAFTITWLARLPAREIRLPAGGGSNAEIRDIFTCFARWGTTIRAFALATELPASVVLAIALDESGTGPAAIAGLGCELRPADALRKALFEICQMHDPLRRRHSEHAAAKIERYTDVRSLEDHAAYFLRHDHLHELDFLLQQSTPIALADLRDTSTGGTGSDIQLLQQSFSQAGYRAVYRDLTTPDLEAYPIRVVRALVTHLQPIGFGHGLQRLGGSRLYERGAVSEANINPCPHPLA